MKPKSLLFAILLTFLLVACSQVRDPAPTPAGQSLTAIGIEQAESTPGSVKVPSTDVIGAPEELNESGSYQATATPESGVESLAGALPQPAVTTATATIVSLPTPIEVAYFTPGQGEGPYYPVNKLADQDNDLTHLAGATGTPNGDIVEFFGTVYDASGLPVTGAVIEIWQTDESGVYLHPGDPGTDQRDRNFQFYGEAITTADGRYSFRTILPGQYEPRPRHIHVKVKFEGDELLTTQFYFEGDSGLADEAMFAQTEDDGIHLIISLTEGQDEAGKTIFTGRRDIILNYELSG